MDEGRLLTPEEVAQRLGIATVTLKDYLRASKIAGVKVGRLWRVREDDLEAYIQSQRREALESPAK